jgi:acetylglutamate/LysW-gamma-L-alpha-aminoadipate kinase
MTIIVKLGGGAGNEHGPALADVAERVSKGARVVIVHGGSDAANKLGEQVGHPAQTIISPGGHTSRYNDARTIEVFGMAVGGVNQQITAQLAALGVKAVGLSGPNVVQAQRKEAIRALRDGRPMVIRDDFSGTISGVNTALLKTLLDAGFTPVVAPLAMGAKFERLNVDGDLVAATIARALDAKTLVILSNVPGLLRDVNDPTSLISLIPLADMERYEAFAGGRMKKKLLAAQAAQVTRVILADSRVDRPIDAAISGSGTHIVKETHYV